MKILVLNGPNINLLGIREPDIYGRECFADLLALLERTAAEEGIEIQQFQSNHEGVLVDKIQEAYGVFDGIVINPAAYTHTSIALLDALKAVGIPAVEVHISDVASRENFRQVSFVRMACCQTITGRGIQGYRDAVLYLKKKLPTGPRRNYALLGWPPQRPPQNNPGNKTVGLWGGHPAETCVFNGIAL